jgi:hypothetical protein
MQQPQGALMTTLHEHVGFAAGETVQIADRPGRDPQFNSVVLQQPEYDALEPLLRAAEPTLHALWRYGETELSARAAERLAGLLTATENCSISKDQVELFRLLSGWIRARLTERRTIYVLGY